jgi:hypothetical protein
MLAFRSWRGVSDERDAPGFSGVVQAPRSTVRAAPRRCNLSKARLSARRGGSASPRPVRPGGRRIVQGAPRGPRASRPRPGWGRPIPGSPANTCDPAKTRRNCGNAGRSPAAAFRCEDAPHTASRYWTGLRRRDRRRPSTAPAPSSLRKTVGSLVTSREVSPCPPIPGHHSRPTRTGAAALAGLVAAGVGRGWQAALGHDRLGVAARVDDGSLRVRTITGREE